MATFAERLASFDVAHPATKKRTSSAKSAKTLRWPHENPSPTQLADAGFLYQPKSSSPDNVTCFLCHSNLDGWEKDDSPIAEHLKLSPDCGWAINVSTEQNNEDPTCEDGGPTSERMSEARRMTFDSRWPHEGKRGWICKAQKMANAGWYYCPTEESDDFVRCAHCGLSLDGWEPKDNPYDEHQRRSADCPFFAQPAPKSKSSRGKKARTSKTSRLSTQSNFTAVSDGISVIISEAENNDSVMVLNNDDTKSEKAGKGSRKGAKAKKPSTKPKGKAAKASVEDSMQASSFVEPEDDDFEVKIAPDPAKPSKSRKRKSEDGQKDAETMSLGAVKGLRSEPPAKKRATRTRASSVQPEVVAAQAAPEAHDGDTSMVDTVVMPPPPPPTSKKGGKGGRKRGSSSVRKASATSTASMASLRATVPDDDTIEAALEADLDRPLTDEEADDEPQPAALPKSRRLTRTKPARQNGPASVAPTRRTTRASTIPTDEVELPVVEPEREQDSEQEQEKKEEQEPEQKPEREPEIESNPKKTRAGRPPKGSGRRVKPSTSHEEASTMEAVGPAEELHEKDQEVSAQTRGTRSRQVSRQAPLRKTRASELSQAPIVDYPMLDANSSVLNSSVLAPHMTEDEFGHETDASVASQGPKKQGPKKRAGAGKKTKAGKKTGMMSRNIEDIVQPEPVVKVIIEQPAPPEVTPAEEPEPIAEEPVAEDETIETSLPAKGSKKKPAKSAKAKTIKAKPVTVPSSPPASQMSEPWTDQPLGESTPMHLSSAEVPAYTPVEATQIAPPPHAATPEKRTPLAPQPAQQTPRLAASPQSSDVENQPPSSRPSALRPPLEMHSPSKAQTMRIPLAASTPTASPSRRNISKLQTSMPWTAVDLDRFLLASPNADKENVAETLKAELASPEKKLTVEEWIYHNARKGEEKLRSECERLVGRFENEGVRALKTLEGIVCAEP